MDADLREKMVHEDRFLGCELVSKLLKGLIKADEAALAFEKLLITEIE
jgi:hypothetical protein